ncbi:HAMP domain-containing histidine kinase [Rubellimicrobium rubrum]|uniref:histidine kinase n=2 Tax=Rubellimicrobium rubrum TaxID=2585369 RepID=A0A5C4MU66_9RHOB|nr:HAMP domain-containing histidine kinase [Rubellimicrobium rubrum]
MESVLDRVGEGDLTARMAVRGSGDLARLAQGINSALVRLERVVEGMRQVSTDIAHDLRTPLGRLRFRIEAAAARATEGSRLAEDLDAALEESDTLDATFAALLRIAEIEAGARRARFAPLDLGEVLVRIVEAYEGVAEEAGQNLSLSLSVTAPIHGDRDLLVQLFANLVENAIRHGPAGTRIECTVTQEGDCPQATLRDTGPGIPAAERELVLRRLYRLEKSRTSPGTGLGLALVKAVADLHGADLILADAGPGLRVTLRFPPFRASA